MNLAKHVHDLPSSPVLDVHGKWVYCRNARVATTSICEGPLKTAGVHRSRNRGRWEEIWERHILPSLDKVLFFVFVRNPWDRICSAFHQCRDRARTQDNKIDSKWTFTDWIKRVLTIKGPSINMHFAEQYPTAYHDNRRFAVVGRFESIAQDWREISGLIGEANVLPKMNGSGHGCYRDHYDDQSRRIVAEMYHREITAFGYEFK